LFVPVRQCQALAFWLRRALRTGQLPLPPAPQRQALLHWAYDSRKL
jgi:hypothetical protein